MKKHLVMIVGAFYPDPSPTGKCAEAYVHLLQDQFDISVICLATADRSSYSYNGKQVYPTADGYTLFQRWLERRHAPRLLCNAAKVPVHLLHQFTHPNLLHSYARQAEKQLYKLHAERPVDVIFSVGAPMAAHVAARNFRRRYPDVRWVTYTVDSYAGQNKNSRRYAGALAFEAQVLSACDSVLLSEEIWESSPMLYRDFSPKCQSLPYLMPPTPVADTGKRYFDADRVNLVFAGRFYKSIRHPEYLLQLAERLEEGYVLHLYCQSDCDSLIDSYVSRSGGRILRHAPVSATEIQQIYAQADVLVNVGNSTPEFKPSKTFEYIASGKPIVNIYYEGQFDAVLAQSPLTLQLQRGTPVDEAAQALQDFARTTRGKLFTRDKIEETYRKHSSEHIRGILRAAVKE